MPKLSRAPPADGIAEAQPSERKLRRILEPEDRAVLEDEKKTRREELERARVVRSEYQQERLQEKMEVAKEKVLAKEKKSAKKVLAKLKKRAKKKAEKGQMKQAEKDPAKLPRWKRLTRAQDCFALFACDIHAALLFVLSASYCHMAVAPTLVCFVCLQ